MAEDDGEDMRANPARANELLQNLSSVTQSIQAASRKTGKNVRLLAVSKLKPPSDILALHNPSSHSSSSSADHPPPLYHFGENYFQELAAKAAALPRSVRWHFIGALQTNKCRPLAEQVPNLWCVESVDAARKADQLDKGRAALAARLKEEQEQEQEQQQQQQQERDGHNDGQQPQQQEEEGEGKVDDENNNDDDGRLRVFVQVNTSNEPGKSGCAPGDAAALCAHIRDACPHLRLQGLMTIGALARSQQAAAGADENEDFAALRDARDRVAAELGVAPAALELSMGMSSDYEAAIAMGSDEVRVGTTIFGERPAKTKGDAEAEAADGTPGEKA